MLSIDIWNRRVHYIFLVFIRSEKKLKKKKRKNWKWIDAAYNNNGYSWYYAIQHNTCALLQHDFFLKMEKKQIRKYNRSKESKNIQYCFWNITNEKFSVLCILLNIGLHISIHLRLRLFYFLLLLLYYFFIFCSFRYEKTQLVIFVNYFLLWAHTPKLYAAHTLLFWAINFLCFVSFSRHTQYFAAFSQIIMQLPFYANANINPNIIVSWSTMMIIKTEERKKVDDDDADDAIWWSRSWTWTWKSFHF